MVILKTPRVQMFGRDGSSVMADLDPMEIGPVHSILVDLSPTEPPTIEDAIKIVAAWIKHPTEPAMQADRLLYVLREIVR